MAISYIKTDELDKFSESSPYEAFVELASKAQARAESEILYDDSNGKKAKITLARDIILLSIIYDIESFPYSELPPLDEPGAPSIDDVLSRILPFLYKIRRKIKDGETGEKIRITSDSRQSILKYTAAIRQEIQKTPPPKGKAEKIEKCLRQIEDIINSRRINLGAVAICIMSLTADTATISTTVGALAAKIATEVEQQREINQQLGLLDDSTQVYLPAPDRGQDN